MNRKRWLALGTVAAAAVCGLRLAQRPQVNAQAPTGCSAATIRGTYNYTISGTILTPAGAVPAAQIGRLFADGSGQGTNVYTLKAGPSLNENIVERVSYVLDSSCSGVLGPGPGNPMPGNVLMLTNPEGASIDFMFFAPSNIVAIGRARRL